MAMPEQVRKQAEAVQAHYKQMTGAANEAQVTEPEAETVEQEVVAEVKADQQEQVPVTQSVAGEQGAADKAPEDGLLQKYRTLQGMYNAEVPRLHSQNKELNARVAQLEQLLATMSAQPTQAPQVTQQQKQKLVTQEDIAEYGESIDVMRRVYQEEVSDLHGEIAQLKGIIQQLQTNVVPQVQAVAKRQAVSAEEKFWNDLSADVPNWQAVNNNQEFHNWLLQVDPLTGITRQTYLESAQQELDARRVANFFRTWLELNGQAAVAQPNRKASASELEKQVAPGRSRSAPAPASDKGRTYSPEDIRNFFNDVRAGKYKGRDAERDRIERDIFAAQREGRITM